MPASEVAGTHSVSVRVFDLTNGSLQTNSNAAQFTVTGRSQATATPTPTPRPTATPSGGATATPTATATGTPTATATVSPTPLATSVSLPTTRISTDPYTNTTSQHRTQVEPYVFAFGSTIIATFQSGRFFDGGSSNVGWATSTNAGGSWRMGFLPGTTRFATLPGPFDRVSDPAVAYDAAHGTWLISTLALTGTNGAAVLAHRSADGVTWSNPVTVAAFGNLDKEWIACDTTSSSPFFGRYYVEWDNHSNGNLIYMSTSTDGGRTWSAPRNTADGATGLGGQPVVQPNGTVIVPIADAFVGSVLGFRSTDGGLTWGSTVTVAPITDHDMAGGLRSEPLPSAEIDGGGNVYVAWHDCRFVANCTANDIVMATSSDGLNWSGVSRVPIDGCRAAWTTSSLAWASTAAPLAGRPTSG